MNNLKALREERGLSQMELAEKVGVGQPMISAWESGFKAPRLENLVKLANVLNVSVDLLLGNQTGQMSL